MTISSNQNIFGPSQGTLTSIYAGFKGFPSGGTAWNAYSAGFAASTFTSVAIALKSTKLTMSTHAPAAVSVSGAAAMTGKMCFSVYVDSLYDITFFGLTQNLIDISGSNYIGEFPWSCGWTQGGGISRGGSTVDTIFTYATGDVISVAVDMNLGCAWFGKNDTWAKNGNPATGLNPTVSGLGGTNLVYPAMTSYLTSTGIGVFYNMPTYPGFTLFNS